MGPKGGALPKVGGAQKGTTATKTATATTKTNAKTEVTKLPTISSPTKTAEELAKEEEIKKAEELAKEEEIKKAEEIAKAEAKKAEEEEAKRIADEEALEAKRIADAVAEEERKRRENGDITLIYEMYNEKFPIINGSTTAEAIDEVYCLSFVMPNCKIHLSVFSPTDKRKLEENGNIDVFVNEDPEGTYKGLAAECTYYVYIEQEVEQLKRDQERMRRIAEGMEGTNYSSLLS